MSREDRDAEKNRRIAAFESMLAQARADAWDEGYVAGSYDGPTEDPTPNPYREMAS